MIEYIRIKNFRSITDATFYLQDVNLLIGANNSGKTNFLKALKFLSDLYNQNPIDNSILSNFKDFDGNNEMSFTIVKKDTLNKNVNVFYKLCLLFVENEIQFIECFGETIRSEIPVSEFNLKDSKYLEKNTNCFFKIFLVLVIIVILVIYLTY